MKYPLAIVAAVVFSYSAMAAPIVLTATGTIDFIPEGSPSTIFGETIIEGDSVTFIIEYDDSTPRVSDSFARYADAIKRVDVLFASGNLVPVTFNPFGGSSIEVVNDDPGGWDRYEFGVVFGGFPGNFLRVDLGDAEGGALSDDSLGIPDGTQFEIVDFSISQARLGGSLGFSGGNDGSASFAPGVTLPAPPNTSSDFDGDAIGDIVWQDRSSGQVAISLSAYTNVGQPLNETVLPYTPPFFWNVVGVDNFDLDHRDEIALQVDFAWADAFVKDVEYVNDLDYCGNLAPIAFWHLDISSDGSIALSGDYALGDVPPADWRMVGSGDIDLNGVTDITLQQRLTGQVVSWLLSSPRQPSVALLPAIQLAPGTGGAEADWRLADTEDMDGDGNIDFVWQNRLDGSVVIWHLDASLQFKPDGGPLSFQPPSVEWLVVDASDRDGDLKADILLQHSSNLAAYTWFLDDLTVLGGRLEPSPPFNSSWEIRNSRN